MSLINCPECSKEVPDKAATCPNCGFAVTSQAETKGAGPHQTKTKWISKNQKNYLIKAQKDHMMVTSWSLGIISIALTLIAILGQPVIANNSSIKQFILYVVFLAVFQWIVNSSRRRIRHIWNATKSARPHQIGTQGMSKTLARHLMVSGVVFGLCNIGLCAFFILNPVSANPSLITQLVFAVYTAVYLWYLVLVGRVWHPTKGVRTHPTKTQGGSKNLERHLIVSSVLFALYNIGLCVFLFLNAVSPNNSSITHHIVVAVYAAVYLWLLYSAVRLQEHKYSEERARIARRT